ncbi:hypothetical protein [uncultured Roseobacter sp.]|uniref:hypothetical protein n=1 Tax=uncultured Roseobacter sp. TaxID=114847 RepID=UPI0026080857|nr:hypothetical protein [uncultured Roseobacter sp.]
MTSDAKRPHSARPTAQPKGTSSNAPEYSLIDFDWDGYTQWTLTSEGAEALLEASVVQMPERAGKLMHFLATDGFVRTPERFNADELEHFIINHCDLYLHPDSEYYLTDFSYEICKDTAALIGSLCQDRVPTLKWWSNNDRTSGMMYQLIGMGSMIDVDHIPLLPLVRDFGREALRTLRKFLGAFHKQRQGFLVKMLLLINYEQGMQA